MKKSPKSLRNDFLEKVRARNKAIAVSGGTVLRDSKDSDDLYKLK